MFVPDTFVFLRFDLQIEFGQLAVSGRVAFGEPDKINIVPTRIFQKSAGANSTHHAVSGTDRVFEPCSDNPAGVVNSSFATSVAVAEDVKVFIADLAGESRVDHKMAAVQQTIQVVWSENRNHGHVRLVIADTFCAFSVRSSSRRGSSSCDIWFLIASVIR